MRFTTWLAAVLAAGLLVCAPATAQKISELPAASTLTGAEQLRGIQGAGCAANTTPCADVSVSPAQIATLANASAQPLDSDLSAIAALTTTSYGRALLTQADAAAARSTLSLGTLATQSGTFSGTSSGTNTGDQTTITGNAGTATTLQTGRTIAITGDLAYTSPTFNGASNVTAAGTLATVNANVGTFGGASAIPVITVNAKGLVTAASTAVPTDYVLAKSAVAVALTGTTTETALATITIPANAIGPNGQVEIISLWSMSPNNANAKTPRIKFGSLVAQSSAYSSAVGTQIYTRIANRGATNSQISSAGSGTGLGSTGTNTVVTAAIDTTASVTITLTGQLATGTDTMTLESYLVRVIPGA